MTMNDANPIRLIIADDHKMFVQALRHLMQRSPDIDVVATTDNGEDLLDLIDRHAPDVALVDVSMPGPGVQAIAQSVGESPNRPKLIALTMHLERSFAEKLIESGFSGYVIKDAAFGELMKAVRLVMECKTYVSKAVLEMGDLKPDDTGGLTPRELECLGGAAEGLSNKAIAKRFGISERTVKYHFENILRKLNADRRGEAVAIGRRRDLI